MPSAPRAVSEPPSADLFSLLPGADFADCYAVTWPEASLDARAGAERIFGRPPAPWVAMLLSLRDAIAAGLGLKTAADGRGRPGTIGMFPVISSSRTRVVLGMDDAHLNFIVVVDAAHPTASETTIRMSTLVRTHNRLGRAYLAVILPFHRRIARHFAQRATRRDAPGM
ncbi:MAG: DUF2867 domain-containing protein [Telmatospirillum sp.]|nr:DUF2867 domain-containing protein [Telmatospirillum sp.]